MENRRNATTCRWATPTLFQPDPMWLGAWDRPWTCVRDPQPCPLGTTDECGSCSWWEPHEENVPGAHARED